MENDKVRNFEEEFWHQVNNKLCGGPFCINPDCYCDEEDDEPWEPRCEWYAEAGESEPGEPRCHNTVTKIIRVSKEIDCDGFLFSCDAHAPAFAKQDYFEGMGPCAPPEAIEFVLKQIAKLAGEAGNA